MHHPAGGHRTQVGAEFVDFRIGNHPIPFDDTVFACLHIQPGYFRQTISQDFKGVGRQRGGSQQHPAVDGHMIAMQVIARHIPIVPTVGAFGQQRFHLFHRQWRVEIISLDVFTPDCFQPIDLLLGLGTLSDDHQMQLLGHHNHGLDDFHAFTGILLAQLDELRVQFDHIDINVFEHVQRGICRTEIIHQHHDASRMQFADGVLHHGQVFRHGAFGDFHPQQTRVDVIFVQQPADYVGHIHLVDIHHRHVHGNRY